MIKELIKLPKEIQVKDTEMLGIIKLYSFHRKIS